MSINVRQKGQTGEREVCDIMNLCIYTVMTELGYSEDECLKGFRSVQRNQNQSAVGGNDLANTFGLSVEVKREEQLSIGTWWRQCVAAAERNNEMPVLIYRQNKKAWTVRMPVWLPLPQGAQAGVIAAIDIESFKVWFKEWVRAKLLAGEKVRS